MAVAERGLISEEDARAHAGEWVAIRDGRVAKASKDAEDVLDWVESQTDPTLYLVTRLPREGAPSTWFL